MKGFEPVFNVLGLQCVTVQFDCQVFAGTAWRRCQLTANEVIYIVGTELN